MTPRLMRLLTSFGLLAVLLATVMPGRVLAEPSLACAPSVSLLANGFGSPDDVAVHGSKIYFGDFGNNALNVVQNGRVRVLARNMAHPEGIVLRPGGRRVVVAEQTLNRVVEIDLKTGHRKTLAQLQNTTGNEGVDGIKAAPHGGIYVPDSPNGTLLLLDSKDRMHFLSGGMARPVDAVTFQGGVAVPDENDHAVWLVAQGKLTRLATLPTPDDVVVLEGHLLATTLGDGALWEITPQVRRLLGGFGQPQGMALLGPDSVVISDSTRNGLYKVSGLGACLAP